MLHTLISPLSERVCLLLEGTSFSPYVLAFLWHTKSVGVSAEDEAIYRQVAENNMGSYQVSAHMACDREPRAMPNSQESTEYDSVHL